jgi:DNA-binding transcriptional regulator YiaG
VARPADVAGMTPAEIRAIIQSLPITATKLDAVMGVSPGVVSRWQRGVYAPSAPALRLLRAYADGYRPSDWPTDTPPQKPR